MATIGFTKLKDFDIGAGQTATLSFWAIEDYRIKKSVKDAEFILVPFVDKAGWLADKRSFLWQGRIRFRFDLNKWPFIDGHDPVEDFYGWLKLQFETENSDGEMINGGIDWTTATEEIV